VAHRIGQNRIYVLQYIVIIAIAVYQTIIESVAMKRKNVPIIILSVGFLGLGYFLWDYLTVDRCLDNGGKWDYSKGSCVGVP
jgi:hypothetical protein